MRILQVLLPVVAVASAIVACVGDAPPSIAPTPQGELGGACFTNGTCNAGLSCGVIEGAAQCVAATGSDASTESDSSIGESETGVGEAGPPVCKFQTTTFPCGGQNPPTACYGATQSCTLTGCNAGDIMWQCNSARQCDSVCCVPASAAAFTPGAKCAEGKLIVGDAVTSGAACSALPACAAGETQLCQANSDCPAGEHCTPVRIGGSSAALSGTIVAACTR